MAANAGTGAAKISHRDLRLLGGRSPMPFHLSPPPSYTVSIPTILQYVPLTCCTFTSHACAFLGIQVAWRCNNAHVTTRTTRRYARRMACGTAWKRAASLPEETSIVRGELFGLQNTLAANLAFMTVGQHAGGRTPWRLSTHSPQTLCRDSLFVLANALCLTCLLIDAVTCKRGFFCGSSV